MKNDFPHDSSIASCSFVTRPIGDVGAEAIVAPLRAMFQPATILLTGFGPFPGVPANASGLLVTRLGSAARCRLKDFAIVAETLPTEWSVAPHRLQTLLQAHKPQIAIHFGVSRTADGFMIETQASNVRGASADACGALPASQCVLENSPPRLPVTLPTSDIVSRLNALGLPARLSSDAGSYLCNTVLFHSLHLSRWSGSRVGFVHIPAGLAAHGPDGTRAAPNCALNWDRAVNGAMEILLTTVAAGTAALANRQVVA